VPRPVRDLEGDVDRLRVPGDPHAQRERLEDPADADAIIVGNTDTVNTAEVQLYLIPNYNITKEEPQGVPIVLQPGESRVFKLYNSLLTNTSSFRTGGVYLVKSDYPISAYLHSPLANSNTNDASLLLPTKALGTEHIIPSFPAYNDAVMPDTANGRPSYFVVIATENDTEVEWTPRAATFGDGTAFDTVQAKQKATASLNRYDVIQVGALTGDDTNFKAQDVSGTIVRANKPVVVMGATSCAKVPFDPRRLGLQPPAGAGHPDQILGHQVRRRQRPAARHREAHLARLRRQAQPADHRRARRPGRPPVHARRVRTVQGDHFPQRCQHDLQVGRRLYGGPVHRQPP
jgi:hypothetical protein